MMCKVHIDKAPPRSVVLNGMVDELIQKMPAEGRQAELDRRLGLAAVHGRPGRMQELLRMGANVEAGHAAKVIDSEGTESALFICCYWGLASHAECARHLLEAGAAACPISLFNACASSAGEWQQAAKSMIEKGIEPTYVLDQHGELTALSCVLQYGLSAELALQLVEAGCPVDGRIEAKINLAAVGSSGPSKPVTLVNPTVADMAAERGWHDVFGAIIAKGGQVSPPSLQQ